MLKKIKNHIEVNKLFATGDRILLAVSGGIDSMVMVHVFLEMKVPIGVAHCNFQLRGTDSDEDEEFVRQFCTQHRLPFFCQRFETNNYATQNGLSIQMAARELRYAWFDQLIQTQNFTSVATAHHLDDSLETSLLNFVRSTGPKGISGIAAKNDYRIRPLLAVTREEIAQYAADHQLAWREDISNFTQDYDRNVIRQRIVPVMKELNPSLHIAFSQFTKRMAGAVELMQFAGEHWKALYWQEEQGRISIVKNGLRIFSEPASVLYEWIKNLGFNLSTCQEIVDALDGQPGKRFMGEGYELVADRETLIIIEKSKREESITIGKDTNHTKLGSQTISMRFEDRTKIKPALFQAFIDAHRLQWPLVWRHWQPGDFFYPLGMRHRKKVSDFLIDQKISLADKSYVTVLQSGEDIVWVVGHRLDDRFKVTDQTSHVLVAELSNQG